MKRSNFVLMVLFMMFSAGVFAQQESQYTQYMYNTSLMNPAYAGSRDVPSIFGMYRNQWVGIDGAPKTSALSFHMPFEGKQVGLGAGLFHESIGPIKNNSIIVDFSYTLPLENSKLAFGIKGTGHFYNFDKSKLNLADPNDPTFLNMKESGFYPNVGAGIYWYGENYYLGLSVPNLLTSRTFEHDSKTVTIVDATQYYYLIAGYVFDLSDNVKFKPAMLHKVAQGAPYQLDLSANFMFNEKFVFGAAYRLKAAVSAMAGFQINPKWFIGYAYDYETTDLRKHTSGSHEIFLRYEFMQDVRRIISPRFF